MTIKDPLAIVIDSDIPLPPVRSSRGGSGITSKLKNLPFAIGNSIGKLKRTDANYYAYVFKKQCGYGIAIRKEKDGLCRVFRIS